VLWDLPVTLEETGSISGAFRVLSVYEPNTKAPHCILVGKIETGKTVWELEIKGEAFSSSPLLRDDRGIVGLKTVPNISGLPYCYLWNNLRVDLPVRIKVPKGRSVWIETYEKGEYGHTEQGRLNLELKWPRPWARVWNVTGREVEINNNLELEALSCKHLKEIVEKYPVAAMEEKAEKMFSEPWYPELPLFLSEYQNAYIDTHYQDMISETGAWFRKMTAGVSLKEILIEAYAYAKGHLGGPWRGQADYKNVIIKKEDVRMEVPIYDYALCHAPGYRSWQMSRMFTLRFFGLSKYTDDDVVVYLHCYDYESMGRSYSLRLRCDDICAGLPVEIVRTTYLLPKGPEGRDDPAALISVKIPKCFLEKEAFDMHILEQYDAKAVDFRKQVPYNVAVSDVWVTRG
jgi:hypothetical protein